MGWGASNRGICRVDHGVEEDGLPEAQGGAMEAIEPGELVMDINGTRAYLRALAERFRRVRVLCGDWSRLVTKGALAAAISDGRPVGIFLDPPYAPEGRNTQVYNQDDGTVHLRVHQWCLENGQDPLKKIILCGYDGSHNELEKHGWQVHAWKAGSSFRRADSADDSGNAVNRDKERIWISPACQVEEKQLSLL